MSNESLTVPVYHLELVRDRTVPYRKANPTESAAQILHEVLDKSPVEQFVVIHVDSSFNMVGLEKVAMGQLEQVAISMREVFRGAILAAVPRIILGHNHPTNDPTPSPQDLNLTTLAVQAGKLLGIEVWDHIVVSPNGKHESIFTTLENELFKSLPLLLEKLGNKGLPGMQPVSFDRPFGGGYKPPHPKGPLTQSLGDVLRGKLGKK